jgi:hypothetical protein
MLSRIGVSVRGARRWFSRSEWLIRLLRLTKTHGAAAEPGLVLIQIDGLSRRQFERALETDHLPFLAELLRKQKYALHSLYSGLPSSTPAMTAELFYGIKGAVPAFSFYERSTKSIFRMFDFHNAKEIEQRLRTRAAVARRRRAYAASTRAGRRRISALDPGLDDLFARYPLRCCSSSCSVSTVCCGWASF